MNSVTTKTGDKGTSGLANGQRVDKDALIFDVLGTQDELNSWIGYSIALLESSFSDQKKFLLSIQETLFYIGAELAASPEAKLKREALINLEKRSELLQSEMEEDWTTKFLFPGGNQAAAVIDITRTVARKLERKVVAYSKETPTSDLILRYVNRLSDYLYVLRCYVNHREQYQENKFERGE